MCNTPVEGSIYLSRVSQLSVPHPKRYDCEYKRNGTANLFIFLDAHRPWRRVKVTDSRAAEWTSPNACAS
jgi:hypothetical protein